MLLIRGETPRDVGQVRMINIAAFEQPDEADLVDALRAGCPEVVSLVAELDGRVVGHILFSPVTVPAGERTLRGMGLAPMAVLPEHQRDGIGARLVEEGSPQRAGAVRDRARPPGYYPRFGFERASAHGIPVCGRLPTAFMIRILGPTAIAGAAVSLFHRPGSTRWSEDWSASSCRSENMTPLDLKGVASDCIRP
jgi:putative acetyltransferase